MIAYIDSSVVLRKLLNQKGQITSFKGFDELVSSQLLLIECDRVLDRLRLTGELSDLERADAKESLKEFYPSLTILLIHERIIQRARGAFPTVIGTLDALHLSSAIEYSINTNKDVCVISHDDQLLIAAKACGLSTS